MEGPALTDPLFVAGMHRSGTSMATALLERAGLPLGPDLVPPSPHNPRGYFEDAGLVALHSRMLLAATAGGRGGWPDWGVTADHLFQPDILRAFADEARSLLARPRPLPGPWGWKDPRSTLLLDFWAGLAPGLRVCLLYRDPWDVVASLQRLGEPALADRSFALQVWLTYNRRVLAWREAHPETTVLAGALRVLERPDDFVRQVAERLGLPLVPPPGLEDTLDPTLLKGPRHPADIRACLAEPGVEDMLLALHEAADLPNELAPPHPCRVSVIIPCRNDGATLAEAVASVERGRRLRPELIIVDDGSDDPATVAVFADLEQQGYRVLHQPATGLSAARNAAWTAASGDYVLPLDADDLLHPNYLVEGVRALAARPDLGVAYSDVCHVGPGQHPQRLPDFYLPRLLAGNYVNNCALIRRAALQAVGGYDEQIPAPHGYEDWELWMRLAEAGWGFAHLPAFLFDYRHRADSFSAACNTPANRAVLVSYLTQRHAALYTRHAGEVATLQQTMSAALVEEQQRALALVQAGAEQGEQALRRQFQQQVEELHREAERLRGVVAVAERKRDEARAAAVAAEHARMTVEHSFTWRMRTYLCRLGQQLAAPRPADSAEGPAVAAERPPLWSYRFWSGARHATANMSRLLYLLAEPRRVRIVEEVPAPAPAREEPWWLEPALDDAARAALAEECAGWEQPPLISILLPVYNTPPEILRATLRSVQTQVYPHWELCIADDASTDPGTRAVLQEAAAAEPRIRLAWRADNGHISRASNEALALARGPYCALLDHDDELAPTALLEVVRDLRAHPETDFLYTDEDKLDDEGRHTGPHLKPDWCPDNLLARNYICHLAVLRTTLLRDIGGFRPGFEGSQDYDLFLRFTERTPHIRHLAKVLYHWRAIAGSAAASEEAKPYAYEAARRALIEALARRGRAGEVAMRSPGYYTIRYAAPAGRVSVLIPAAEQAPLLERCLHSLFTRTAHPDFDVIVVDHASRSERFASTLTHWQRLEPGRLRVLAAHGPFNFPRLINLAAAQAGGEFLLLLNSDVEILHADWMQRMAEYAQHPEAGAVGARLLYPGGGLQHAGVLLGLNGVADHYLRGYPADWPGLFHEGGTPSNFSALTAACLMVRRSLFEAVGGLDPELPVDFNDVDFCLRLRARGQHNLCLPDVHLLHHESASRGRAPGGLGEGHGEAALLRTRWAALLDRDPCFPPVLLAPLHREAAAR